MFWQYQAQQDALFLAIALGWVLMLVILQFTPGLMGVILGSYQHRRMGTVPMYISRFMPYALFEGLLGLSKGLSLALIGFAGLRYYGADMLKRAPQLSELALYLGIAVGLVLVLQLLRYLHYALWSQLFFGKEERKMLQQDYGVLSLLLGLGLMLLTLCLLRPELDGLTLALGLGLFALSRLLRIWQAGRRLLGGASGYVAVFLYLCTHELLPWVYLALVVELWSRGDFVNIMNSL